MKKRVFVDTNVFLRFLLRDVGAQHKKAKEIILSGSRSEKNLFTSLVVIFEVYWVLASFYKKKRRQLAKILLEILRLEFIGLEEREVLIKALKLYQETSFDFEDCYNLVFAIKMKAFSLATFDVKLKNAFKKRIGS